MPAELEPHAGCWMAWPERPDNWRLGARARRRRPTPRWRGDRCVRAGDDGGLRRAVRARRARLLRGRCAWSRSRPTTPGCATSARPSCSTATAAARASTGASTPGAGSTAGSTSPGSATSAWRARCSRSKATERYRAPDRARGRLDPRRRRGHGADHRGVPAEPQPQPGALARADRAGAVRIPRRREGGLARPRACSTTRPTATSTTSPASPGPGSCCSPGARTVRPPARDLARRAGAPAKRRRTPAAVRSR